MKPNEKQTSKSTESTSPLHAKSGKAKFSKAEAATRKKNDSRQSAKQRNSSSQSSTRGAKGSAGLSRRGQRTAANEKITTYRLGDPIEDLTDWKRVEAMTDEEIERNAASDPDSFPVGSFDWTDAQLVIPVGGKESIHMRIDPDVYAWFRAQGPGHTTRMSAVLRNYYEAHKGKQAK